MVQAAFAEVVLASLAHRPGTVHGHDPTGLVEPNGFPEGLVSTPAGAGADGEKNG
jgi:hypothetical protein